GAGDVEHPLALVETDHLAGEMAREEASAAGHVERVRGRERLEHGGQRLDLLGPAGAVAVGEEPGAEPPVVVLGGPPVVVELHLRSAAASRSVVGVAIRQAAARLLPRKAPTPEGYFGARRAAPGLHRVGPMPLPLEAVPNFSEGRDRSVIDALGTALGGSAELLDVHADADH